MNSWNVVTDKWAGPHVDQSARDLLDDLGLVGGTETYQMEVVG